MTEKSQQPLNGNHTLNSKKFISYNGYQLHYSSFGNGSQSLLAFHGFNRTGSDWSGFEKYIGNTYTIYAFDLFYHGNSTIDEKVEEPYIGKTELSEMVTRFMMEKKITRISLIGYSLGGKLALSLIETMPGQIDNVFLLAPDGIKKSFWNNVAVNTAIGRMLFNHVIKDPRLVLKISSLFAKTHLIHHKLDVFIRTHLLEARNRIKVLNIWTLFKDLSPDKKRVRKHILRYKINLQMFYGKYDAIIPYKTGLQFADQLNIPCFHLLDCGHNMNGMVYEISTVINNTTVAKTF